MKQHVIAIILLFSSSLFAQNYDRVIERTNVEALKKMAKEIREKQKAERQAAIEFCEQNGYPTYVETPDGQIVMVDGFTDDGRVQYISFDNLNAARTIATDKIQPKGLPNKALSGRGINLGVWDSGFLPSHVDFGGRMTVKDGIGVGNHGTHVSGTMMATGVNAGARGMANEASISAYGSGNDEPEMALEAAGGMLVSNHSYGIPYGWENAPYSGNTGWHWLGNTAVSQVEDWGFGYYNSTSVLWDNIHYNAPYYLACKSAGNERSETGPGAGGSHWVRNNGGQWVQSTTTRNPDGPYNCINNPAESKNNMVVAAVNDVAGGYSGPGSVVMSSFSSWGGSDDGRIKPDISANGVNLFSTSSNGGYTSLSGTSMSTPNLSGSLALLQEHHANLNNGNFMLAATLKGLTLHTADECGPADGPDYQFGWGLANTNRAADYISLDSIRVLMEEVTLNDQQTIIYQVMATGNEPLKATICWMDTAGTPGAAFVLNDRTPKLVNDLDLRIIGPSDTTLPWTLDINNPTQPAQKGDNTLDVSETVILDNPNAGLYTIQITHKGSLAHGDQDVSLIVSGIIAGDTMDHCHPEATFQASEGIFNDGSDGFNYSINRDCRWLIDVASGPVTLEFQNFDLESGADFVEIYDGNSMAAPLLASYSGSTLPASVTSTGNNMYVRFTSDANDGANDGFQARYSTPCQSFQLPTSAFITLQLGDTCLRQVKFINQSLNYTSVLWDYGNGVTSDTMAATHDYFYPDGGTYTVTLHTFNECVNGDSLDEVVQVPCDIDGLKDELEQNLSIFPNPSSGEVWVDLGEKNLNGTIEILDISGRLMLAKEFSGTQVKLDLSVFDKGVYILQVHSQGALVTRKLVRD